MAVSSSFSSPDDSIPSFLVASFRSAFLPALAIALCKALESSLKAELLIGPRSEIGILRLSASIWFPAIDKMEPLNVGLISKLELMELSFR